MLVKDFFLQSDFERFQDVEIDQSVVVWRVSLSLLDFSVLHFVNVVVLV